ncbi:hypothetical protein ACWC2T_14910 [Streptomyces sp. NPDC001393]
MGFDPSATSPYVCYTTPFGQRGVEGGGAVWFVRAPGGGCADGAL